MKKVFLAILLFCSLSLHSQNLTISKEDIVGRWIEERDTDNESENAYTYIFRDNMVFHLGEAYEGVILFNIAGKYAIQGDTISVIFYDFVHGSANNRKARHISFKVLSIDKDKMSVLAKDEEYEYKLFLKRQKL